ncbi:hypothetical protein [Salinicola socius]|uniref:Uncharacterized protein n=1 Tax=Salinicola socius TaxID=404433 RepID=A0A1Q8SNM9_9GAMM|nr:hypothetical protein [Salinicola socius]OLO03047.1 hypothetical protein BTW07_16020 [Salinicola socius]
MPTLSFRTVASRAGLYILFLAGLMQAVLMVDARHPVAADFSETSLTEITQAALLFLCTVLMLIIRQRVGVLRNVSLLLAAFFAISLVRENDLWLDTYLFDGAWEWLVVLMALPALLSVLRSRRAFLEEFSLIANSLGFGLFAGGFLTTYVFSRLYGRSELWHALMGDHYLRIVKDAAEEITELTGYSLLLFASVELLLLARRLRDRRLLEAG